MDLFKDSADVANSPFALGLMISAEPHEVAPDEVKKARQRRQLVDDSPEKLPAHDLPEYCSFETPMRHASTLPASRFGHILVENAPIDAGRSQSLGMVRKKGWWGSYSWFCSCRTMRQPMV